MVVFMSLKPKSFVSCRDHFYFLSRYICSKFRTPAPEVVHTPSLIIEPFASEADSSASPFDCSIEMHNLQARLDAIRGMYEDDDTISTVTSYVSAISPTVSSVSYARHYQNMSPVIGITSLGILENGRTEL